MFAPSTAFTSPDGLVPKIHSGQAPRLDAPRTSTIPGGSGGTEVSERRVRVRTVQKTNASGDGPRGRQRLIAVRRSEQRHVDEQRVELVQRHPLAPAVRERCHLLV